MRLGFALLLIFAALFATRILLPLKIGGKAKVVEQSRPGLPQPLYETSQEQEFDEQRFQQIVQELSESTHLPAEQVKQYICSSLQMMQSKLPFTFAHSHYSLLCLPPPSDDFEVHKRLYLGDSSIGVPIYLDVRVYDATKKEVLEKLFASLEGEFTENRVEHGVSFIGHGKSLMSRGHGIGNALGERTLFFHLVELEGRCYVAFADAPSLDLDPLLENSELAALQISNK